MSAHGSCSVWRRWLVVLSAALLAVSQTPTAASGSPGFGVDDSSGRQLAAGRFSDVVDDNVHRPAIEALADDGIFEGTECEPGSFCPDEPILRWEMAVWLVRILDRYDPPAAASTFGDVEAGQWWSPFVERLALLGVTKGCSADPALFCPHRAVTRAQMASFLVRAFGLGVGPPAGFGDLTPGGTHAANIDALAASGVTRGCTETMFCPGRDTTRAQMATFIYRAGSAGDTPGRVPTFDPYTTPTLSDIDLEALGAAVDTLDSDAVCPPTVVPGSLDDIAEVVRISGGCLNVEYVPISGRSIGEVREELADDPEVHAVGRPVTEYFLDSFPHDSSHEQWHLEEIEADKLWDGWTDNNGRRWACWPWNTCGRHCRGAA